MDTNDKSLELADFAIKLTEAMPQLHAGQIEVLLRSIALIDKMLAEDKELKFKRAVSLTAYQYGTPWRRIADAYEITKGVKYDEQD